MACISCGVITSAWLWRSRSFWVSAIDCCLSWSGFCLSGFLAAVYPTYGWRLKTSISAKCLPLHAEFLAEIKAPHVGVIDDVVRRPLHQHFARVDDVGAV